MRVYVPVLVSVLLGAVVGGLLFLLPLGRQHRPVPSGAGPQQTVRPAAARTIAPTPVPAPSRAAARPGSPSPAPATLPPPPEAAGGDVAGDALASARVLVAAGRLRDAQDEYVQVLLIAPDNEEAWRELVEVRRRLARDDAALLRRQAAAYRRAIARGEETEEHYTVPAMRILAQASLIAAQEIEEGQPGLSPPVAQPAPLRPTPSPAPTVRVEETARPAPAPRPSPRTTRRRPTPRPTPRQVSTPVPRSPVTPPPVIVTPAPATPTAQPSLDVNEPFFLIQIGPLSDANRAAEIAADLTVAGYSARVSRPGGGTSYFITLGPYRRSVVDAIVKSIRSRFGSGLPVAVTPAP